jgi:hypothetical protein
MARFASRVLSGASLSPPLGTRDYARHTLRPRHRLVVRAFAEALFFDTEPLPRERLDAFADEIDGAMSNASKTLRFGLRLALDVIRLAPVLVLRRLQLFEALSLPARIRMLEKMEAGTIMPLQLIFVAYKTLMAMVFFEEPSELHALGYPGSTRERYKLAPPPALR